MALTDYQIRAIAPAHFQKFTNAVLAEFSSGIEAAAAAPLLARIAELERHNKSLVERREFDVRDIVESTSKLVELEHRCEALTAQVEQAAQPVAWDIASAVFTVLEGYTLHPDARKILESAYYGYTAPPKAVPLTDEQTTLAAEAVDAIMTQVQVFASAYSLIGSRFDGGNAQDDSDEAKAELRTMVVSLAYEAAHGITPATVEKGETP